MPSTFKPAVIWGLFAVGIAAILTPFIGILLVYIWKGRTADPWEIEHFETQARVFRRAALGWGIAIALIAVALYVDVLQGPVGDGEKPLLFSIGLLIGVVTQIWFTLRALWGLIRSFGQPNGPPNDQSNSRPSAA